MYVGGVVAFGTAIQPAIDGVSWLALGTLLLIVILIKETAFKVKLLSTAVITIDRTGDGPH